MEELEHSGLSAWGTRSAESKGRETHETPDPLRMAFADDIDRIMRSAAFRRLKDKTRTLLAPDGDGYRARLDHTLAGARVARAISRVLRLNEDLTEAIALGRDLGAAAFARVAEEAFSVFGDEPFRHHEQSVRTVERIEQDGMGLNLTWEVRDGIATHGMDAPSPATLEGAVVRAADHIVSVVGDLLDAQATGVILASDLPEGGLRLFGDSLQEWADALIADVVHTSRDVPEVGFSEPATLALEDVGSFVVSRIHERPGWVAERARGIHCLRSLVVFYMDNPGRLPALHRRTDEPLAVRAVDFVASLSDGQALRLFNRLFVPKPSPHRL